ncbi:MAG: hypothetical protein ABR579_03095, partial [Actinomycetota bacterium]
AVSPDGNRAYIYQIGRRGGGKRAPFKIATIDTRTGNQIGQSYILDRGSSGCTVADLLPLTGDRLIVLCYGSEAFLLSIADDGSVQRRHLELPGAPLWAAVSPDESTLYAATRDARVFVISVEDMSIQNTLAAEVPSSPFVGWRNVVLSPDGGTLYLGMGRDRGALCGGGCARNIVALDSRSGDVIWSAPLNETSWDLSIDPSGQRIYATSTEKGDVLVVDTKLRKQVATYHVGGTPMLVDVLTR